MRDSLLNFGKGLSPLNLFLLILIILFVVLAVVVGISILLKGIIAIKNKLKQK